MSNFARPFARILALSAFCMGACLASTGYASTITGTVQSGGTRIPRPLRGAQVTLYEATELQPVALGSATTNFRGEFEIDSPRDSTPSIFFATADIRFGVRYVAIIGPELLPEVTINELTTVAASYSMAQFYRTGEISGDAFALQIAAGMNDNIVSPITGESSEVLLTSPNADETNSLRSTRALANLLAAAADNFIVRLLLIQATRSYDGTTPSDTSVALANLARDPGQNVPLLYVLSKFRNAYTPALVRKPDAWTVTVKVNDSGDDNFLFGGPANVAFDSKGYVWVTNNVVQRSPNSSRHIMVLQPNGKPAAGEDGAPISPITGGGILGTAWGVTVDPFDNVWFGNFGWGSPFPDSGDFPTRQPPGNGSVSVIAPDGTPISGNEGFYGSAYRVQAIESDSQGNVWMASFGNDRLVLFPEGNPRNAVFYQQEEHTGPFGVAIDEVDGTVWMTNSGGLTGRNQSSIAKFELGPAGQIRRVFKIDVGDTLKVVDLDSQGNAWFTSQGNDRVYAVQPDGTFFRQRGYGGGGMDGPWGLAIDGEDNVWIANFGQTERGVFRRGGLTKLAGINPAYRPADKAMGGALSPPSGYTVPSGGSQVLSHDGTPLTESRLPTFIPLQRQTSLQIDRAGNIWTINNYKPRWSTDFLAYDNGELTPADADPGGDGLIIFVGLAPTPRQW